MSTSRYTLEDGSVVNNVPNNYTGKLTNQLGSKYWYQDGKRHRLDGPAIDLANGSKYWYQYGKLHRLDGPAIEYAAGGKCWYQEGERHRLDGPAVEFADGSKCWFIQNKQVIKTTQLVLLCLQVCSY